MDENWTLRQQLVSSYVVRILPRGNWEGEIFACYIFNGSVYIVMKNGGSWEWRSLVCWELLRLMLSSDTPSYTPLDYQLQVIRRPAPLAAVAKAKAPDTSPTREILVIFSRLEGKSTEGVSQLPSSLERMNTILSGYSLIRPMRKSHSASFWISFKRICSVSSYTLGMSERRSFNRHVTIFVANFLIFPLRWKI